MPREIRPGVHWIQECGPDRSDFLDESDPPDWYEPGREMHIPQNAYLFVGEESLLFDTLSPASTDHVLSELDEALDGGDLDYLLVSHPDLPHAGNAMAILREHPEATLLAPRYGTGHELYHLEDAAHVGEGDSIDLGGHVVDFHEAYILDAPVSVWASERTANWLLPVDWLGFPHLDTECLRCVDELDRDVDVDRLVEFHGRVLFWFQYVDVEKMSDLHDFLVERFAPDGLLPTHGLPIREDATRYVELMDDVVERINSGGRVGTLG
jgi:flavorubredoxin